MLLWVPVPLNTHLNHISHSNSLLHMKYFITCLLALAATLQPLSAQNTQSKGLCNTEETLLAGTPVIIENIEKIDSDRSTTGKTFNCKVVADVVVKGKILIAGGSMAVGRVKKVDAGTYSRGASITLVVTHVQTVDGQLVAVVGDEQTFDGEDPRMGTSVQPGQRFINNVTNNVGVKPRN